MCDDRKDDELIAMIAAGESAAFETLYHRYAATIYQTVLRAVQDPALAEDLVQDVFWRVWRRSTCFTGQRGQVVAWLRAVARNMSIDEIRRMRARPVLIHTEVAHAHIDQLPDEQADVLDSTMQQEQRRMIVAALQQLPNEQRQVIELNYFGGRSYKEIAAALNRPLGTVKTRARLGLRKLKGVLATEDPRASLVR
jgi:RNA polymerase sigma-70 factor (ECF subfamily)